MILGNTKQLFQTININLQQPCNPLTSGTIMLRELHLQEEN